MADPDDRPDYPAHWEADVLLLDGSPARLRPITPDDAQLMVEFYDRVAFVVTVGPKMIAVGRYDRLDSTEAEVAFLVEDAHQGRGLAQLLLEHLAEAGRERGITKFLAEVLPTVVARYAGVDDSSAARRVPNSFINVR